MLILAAFMLTEGCDCTDCVLSQVVNDSGEYVVVEKCSAEDYEDLWFFLMSLRTSGNASVGHALAKRSIRSAPDVSGVGRLRGSNGVDVRVMVPDGAGNLYVGGLFTEAIGVDEVAVQAENIVMWEAAGRDGKGRWRALGAGLNGPVQALALDEVGRLYAGGAFVGSPGDEVPLLFLARWSPDAERWEPVGRGVRGGASPNVQALAFDESGRLLVAGNFIEAVDAAGTAVTVNGIARWDPSDETWSPLGEGFQTKSFTGLVTGAGEEVLVSGQLSQLGQGETLAVVRWDGAAWTPYDEGIAAASGVNELVADSEGTRYVRYYRYDPVDYQNSGFRIARRGPEETAWTTIARHESLTGISASEDTVGVLAHGRFTEMGNQLTNGQAYWNGTAWEAVLLPGTCGNLQLIHAMADPDALPVDLVLDGEPVVRDFAYGRATSAATLQIGHPYQARLVMGGGTAGKWLRRTLARTDHDTLFAVDNLVFDERTCVGAAVGVLAPDDFAPNPDGMDTQATLAVAELPEEAGKQSNMASLLVLHGVTDAPTLDVQVDGQPLIEDLAFGAFSEVLTVPPGTHRLTLVREDDGRSLGTYTVDLTQAAGQLWTLALTGFLDPERNGGGPALTVASVDPSGTTTVVPTAAESTPAEMPAAVQLLHNYPNPVTTTTIIAFDLARPEHVRLAVYDMLGREVAALLDGSKPAGRHEIAFTPEGLAGGTYLYRLDAGGTVQTRMLQVVR